MIKTIYISRDKVISEYAITINKGTPKDNAELKRFITDIRGLIEYKAKSLVRCYKIPENNLEDIQQEMFLTVLNCLPKAQNKKDFKYYLYRSFENMIKNKVSYVIGRVRLGMEEDYTDNFDTEVADDRNSNNEL